MALQNDLTQGSVEKHIIRFAIPLIISNLFQALYNAVDMFFIGRYTTTASLSAVSAGGPIMNIMIMTITGLSMGVTVLIGRHAGEDNNEEIRKTGNTAIALYLLLALITTLLGVIFAPLFLRLVHTPTEAFSQAVIYLRTIFLGVVFTFGYNLIGALQRGFGDSKSSMIFVIIAGLCNILLDYIFIAILSMGAFGAALATVIAQCVSLVLGILYFRRKKHVITFSPKEIRISKPQLMSIVKTGFPAALQQFILNISLTTLSGFANSYGLEASAAYGVCVKIDNFAVLPLNSINMSVSAFASQNLGAKKEDRALLSIKKATNIAVVVAVCLGAIIFAFASPLTRIFNQDELVLDYAVSYLRISAFTYLPHAFVYPRIGFVRGSGNTIQTLKNVILSQYVVRIPVALLCSHFFGFPGLACAGIVSQTFCIFTYSLYIRSGKWRKALA